MKAILAILISLIFIGLLGLRSVSTPADSASGESLMVFCTASMKQPVEIIARQYEQRVGVEVALQFGGTGTLVSQIQLAKRGDLFIAADQNAITIIKKLGLAREILPLVKQVPVVVVKAGNPKNIRTLDDLFRSDVRVGIGNPEATSIGKATQTLLADRWNEFATRLTVMKPTVTEVAMDVTIGSIDAAIVWNSTAAQFEKLETIRLPELDSHEDIVNVAVLNGSANPTAALRFARYLAARDQGASVLTASGFDVVSGENPEIETRP